jgi:hypothetical protein
MGMRTMTSWIITNPYLSGAIFYALLFAGLVLIGYLRE